MAGINPFINFCRVKNILFILLITLIVHTANAQRVGVVLSGGGAKGAAHIGVLKALEEEGIPIDYIVGTSMGAIVGAFYSAGYSPEEIEEIIRNPVFSNWVNGTNSERYHYNYTRAQDNASWFTFDLLLDKSAGPTVNTPLANDLIINFILNEYLAQASQRAEDRFDGLFVPYRAVAADLFTQTAIPIDSGSVMQAARSSMAVPLFYRPIKVANKYLFDGGIYNNFPVDVMEETFEPDVVIGSNVGTKISAEYPFGEDEHIMNDMLLFMVLDKTDPSRIGENNLYIEPNIVKESALAFDKVGQFIDSGYVATKRQLKTFKPTIKDTISKDLIQLQRQEFKADFEDLAFGRLELYGFDDKQSKFVQKLISFKNGTRDLEQIKSAYFQLVSEPYFKNVYPNFSYDSESKYFVLEFYLKPTARNSLSIDVGGNLSTRQINTLQVGARLNSFNRRLNTYELNFSTGLFYESVLLRSRFNYNPKTRFYFQPKFTYNHWDYVNSKDILTPNRETVLLDRIDREIGGALGFGTGQRGVISTELSHIRNTDEFNNSPSFSSDDYLDRLELKALNLGFRYERNSLDRKQFPKGGSRFYADLQYYGGSADWLPGTTSIEHEPIDNNEISRNLNWFTAKVSFEEFSEPKGAYTFGWTLDAQFSTIDPLFNYQSTLLYLPSFEPMFDAKTYYSPNFRAQYFLAAGVKNIFQVAKSLEFRLELYAFEAFKWAEEGVNQEAVVNTGFSKPRFMGMAGFVYNTILGPVSLRLNYMENQDPDFGLMLSVGYTIFNQKSVE